MERVLAQAAENGRKATVTAVERVLGSPHATFDRNYRHLIDGFRQRAQQHATAVGQSGSVRAGNDPDQVMYRLRRVNEDLRRLVKIYAESIRQLTLDHLELEAKLGQDLDRRRVPDRSRPRDQGGPRGAKLVG